MLQSRSCSSAHHSQSVSSFRIHSFIPDIYIAPLKETYSEAGGYTFCFVAMAGSIDERSVRTSERHILPWRHSRMLIPSTVNVTLTEGVVGFQSNQAGWHKGAIVHSDARFVF